MPKRKESPLGFTFTSLIKNFGFGEGCGVSDVEVNGGEVRMADSKESAESASVYTASSKEAPEKKTLKDIAMKVTEVAEEMFLFGTQDYHRRAAKRRKRVSSEDSSGTVRDFRLPTAEVCQLAKASSCLLDNEP